MKFDFSNEAFFDNHTHLLFQDKLEVTEAEFVLNYYHGIRDEAKPDGTMRPSQTAIDHMSHQGVILTLVNLMAQRFDIEPTLKSVVAFRNQNTKTPQALRDYTEMLFKDQNVWGSMLDAGNPMGDPKTFLPGKVFRLYQYETPYLEFLKTEDKFDVILEKLFACIRKAAAEGFNGLKGHIAELCGLAVREVSEKEAQAALPKAKQGDPEAFNTVYYAMFSHLLELCQEVKIPLHLHTGTTGMKQWTAAYSMDPILLAPYLKNPRYFKTKIFLLHGSFPFTRHAAIMAYNFPNIYLDLSWALPWQSLLLPRILEDVLSVAPHDKVFCGTGQHDYTETVWLASKITKSCLANVMENLVSQNLLSQAQAAKSASMILHQNGRRFYEEGKE